MAFVAVGGGVAAAPQHLDAQETPSVEVGLGVSAHVIAPERDALARIGLAGALGLRLQRYDLWTLNLELSGARIAGDFATHFRYALTARARTGATAETPAYLVAGIGMGIASVVLHEQDVVAIGDEVGLAVTVGVGRRLRAQSGRWAVETTLLGHLLLSEPLWTATATLRRAF